MRCAPSQRLWLVSDLRPTHLTYAISRIRHGSKIRTRHGSDVTLTRFFAHLVPHRTPPRTPHPLRPQPQPRTQHPAASAAPDPTQGQGQAQRAGPTRERPGRRGAQAQPQGRDQKIYRVERKMALQSIATLIVLLCLSMGNSSRYVLYVTPGTGRTRARRSANTRRERHKR